MSDKYREKTKALIRNIYERGVELFGFFLLFCALVTILALFSYCSEDRSANTEIEGIISNIVGAPGSYYSDLMLQLFGTAAYIFSFVLIAWGYQLIMYHTVAFYQAIACIFSIFGGSVIASLYCGSHGGVVGKLIGTHISNYASFFNFSDIDFFPALLIIGFAACFLVAIRFSFSGICESAAELSGYLLTVAEETRKNIGSSEESATNSDGDTKKRKHSAKDKRKSEKEVDFAFPPLGLLKEPPRSDEKIAESELQDRADNLIKVLNDFGIEGEITNVGPGPVVTLYELKPAAGIKSSRVIGLSSDIARYMSAISARVAVVPGKNALGIELPNPKRQIVYLREILESNVYRKSSGALPIALGKDISGGAIVSDLAKMPHLLIAGTTGSGKSVGINAMILSLLYRLSPAECKFIMIDPKMLELSVYDDIPHLLIPVVTDPKKAVVALKWAVKEMESRYKAMSKIGVRNIEGYNSKIAALQASGEPITRRVHTGFDQETGAPIYEDQNMEMDQIPYIVIIVDEMADLMLVAGKDIEGAVQRLAQMARAAGIHLIMATQRPSVDVITGTIKANFPTRISFQVSSKIDSRTILGEQGAEQLLGQGDMLYMASGGRTIRIHCPFVSDEEVEKITNHLKEQGEPQYITSILDEEGDEFSSEEDVPTDGNDPMYKEAVSLILREGKASTSFLQRHLKIGYNRAARIIDMMEAAGIVSAANHVGKREIIGR